MRRTVISAAVVATLAGGLLGISPAAAVQPSTHEVVVNADPVNWTPHVLDGKVRAMAEVGWDIHSARVSTLDGEARDAFYITDLDGHKLPLDVTPLILQMAQDMAQESGALL